MKKFAGIRPLSEIKRLAEFKKYEVDTDSHDRGSEWIWLRDARYRLLQVRFNVVDGQFVVYAPVGVIATEKSMVEKELVTELSWYIELMEMFYLPMPESEKALPRKEEEELSVMVEGDRVIVSSEGIVFTGNNTPILDDPVNVLRETLKAYERLAKRVEEALRVADQVKSTASKLSERREG